MTRTGPSREARADEWKGRLENAKGFHGAAKDLLDLHEDGPSTNPILTVIVHAAIAYGDALTASVGRVNQKDHSALPKLVQDALGRRADPEQIRRLQRILDEKDSVSYGARRGTTEQARKMYEQLERFGTWAKDILS
ncbi:MAG TPA: hypothetical protein VFE05_20400 [Longimicrobiaceae bacterium]|jgi:hypothetical protein|nr:hypothetical protein [Longimicrobiaceae bacterium]